MKARVFLLVACLLLFRAASLHALDVPPLKGYVNDYANMISPPARTLLERELREFEQSDSTQIVILTIESLRGDALESFSMRVAEAWKIGQKGKDNGVILLVAKQERRTRLEVGRGLEGKLTDLTAGRIVQLVINPQFKRGDFDAGFISGVRAVVDATHGEFRADRAGSPSSKRGPVSSFMPLVVFGTIFLLVLGRISRYLGGAAGMIGFPLIGAALGLSLIALIYLGVLGLVLGIVLPFFFPGPFTGSGGFHRSTWGAGGGFGSGGFGSGGFGGGGFSGGGGGFGGGGASGGW